MGGEAGRRLPAATVDEAPAARDAAPSVLRLAAGPDDAAGGGARVVVADTTWTAPAGSAGDGPIALRDIGSRVLAERDLIAEATELLDRWVAEAGIVDALTIDGTSWWHYYRLRTWMWLQEELLWVAIARRLLEEVRPERIEAAAGVEPALVEAIRLVAAPAGLAIDAEAPAGAPGAAAARPRPPSSTPAAGARARTAVWIRGRLRWLRNGVVARVAPDEATRRRRLVAARLRSLAREPGRLLVVLEHARQRIETPSGARHINPYLGPVVDRLRDGRLDPVEIDIRSRLASDEAWATIKDPGAARLLPSDAIWLSGAPWPADEIPAAVDERAGRIAASSAPLVVDGVDLAPLLRDRTAADVRRSGAGMVRNAGRIRRLLRRLRPAGILIADEYHRQEWLAAAAAEGIPVAAVQHGLIWGAHAGYIHPARPAGLRLADRTYVFGRWERDLLRLRSVYRDEEVRVAGSPRLALAAGDGRTRPPDGAAGRAAVREELGVAPKDRMVVVSGTWGALYRRFHYPVGLAALVDRPLPGVHLVIKLHPGEPDEGPYRAVIEGAARGRGFDPPPVTVVRSIDLYRLLGAADAHVGLHSTVLTEAVWAGTPNLLLDLIPAADLLGYVAAGVARPIRSGGDLLAELEHPQVPDAAARRRFLDAHFEPGDAAERIAADLLAWLP